MRVCVPNGPRNDLDIGRRSVPALETGDGGCWIVFMPFLKPLMPQTHIVPGFRSGPDLPSPSVRKEAAQAASGQTQRDWVNPIRCSGVSIKESGQGSG